MPGMKQDLEMMRTIMKMHLDQEMWFLFSFCTYCLVIPRTIDLYLKI